MVIFCKREDLCIERCDPVIGAMMIRLDKCQIEFNELYGIACATREVWYPVEAVYETDDIEAVHAD